MSKTKSKARKPARSITTFFTEKDSDSEEEPPTEPIKDYPADLILQATWHNKRFKLPDLANYLASIGDIFFVFIDENGIAFRAMDPSHVAILDVLVDKRDFSEYIFNRKEQLQVRINLTDFHRKLKRYNDQTDQIHFFLDEEALGKSHLKLDCKKIHFEASFLDDEEEEIPNLAEIDFNSTITINLSDLAEIVDFASDYTDYVYVDSDTKYLTLHGIADDGTSFHRQFEADEKASLNPASCMYSIEYLVDVLKITSKGGLKKYKAFIEFATDSPIRLTVKIGYYSRVLAILSPRVEEEDDFEDIEAEEAKFEESTDDDDGQTQLSNLNKLLKLIQLPIWYDTLKD